jgi:hypothetical protein
MNSAGLQMTHESGPTALHEFGGSDFGSFIDQSEAVSAEPDFPIEALRERTKVKTAKSANHKQRLTKLHF